MTRRTSGQSLEFHPVTADRWPDMEKLFRESEGEPGGDPHLCWCMESRLTRAQWKRRRGEGNRRAMKGLIDSGQVPGILTYAQGEPLGWYSISPRRGLTGLKAASSFKRPGDPSVWSIVCFYIPERSRGQGVMSGLLRAAVKYAAENGARVVEGYPADPNDPEALRQMGYMGVISAFQKTGFVETARPASGRATMKYYIEERV